MFDLGVQGSGDERVKMLKYSVCVCAFTVVLAVREAFKKGMVQGLGINAFNRRFSEVWEDDC